MGQESRQCRAALFHWAWRVLPLHMLVAFPCLIPPGHKRTAHAGSRTRVISMGGLCDAAALRALLTRSFNVFNLWRHSAHKVHKGLQRLPFYTLQKQKGRWWNQKQKQNTPPPPSSIIATILTTTVTNPFHPGIGATLDWAERIGASLF